MPDPTPTPTPPPTPVEAPARSRGTLNQDQVDDLNKAEQLAQIAQQPDFAAALSGRDIDSAFVATLQNDIAAARTTAGSAVTGSASRQSATASERLAMEELTDALREIQAAAKQKYADADEAQLGNYYIGERMNQRARLEQIAAAIGVRLSGATPADTLPGINATKVTRLQTLAATYRNSNVAQTTAQGGATGARSALSDQVESINKRRRQLQFAADAEWPSSNDNNAATRRAFQLPANRPFTG